MGDGRVEIVSMNHGFAVAEDGLPDGASPTYVSLFDGTNSGFAIAGAPIKDRQERLDALDRHVQAARRAAERATSGDASCRLEASVLAAAGVRIWSSRESVSCTSPCSAPTLTSS